MISLGIFKKKRKNDDFHHINLIVDKWPDHVVTLEMNNFDEFIQKYPVSVVDFWASWCAPCRKIAPRIRRLSQIYNEQVAFGKLDIEKNQDIAKQYKIMGIPHLAFFFFGKKVSSMTGVKSIRDIESIIEGLLKKGG